MNVDFKEAEGVCLAMDRPGPYSTVLRLFSSSNKVLVHLQEPLEP